MTTQEHVTQGFRLSPQQERIWRLLAIHPTKYRARCSVSLTGKLDIERLQNAVRQVVARQEILRTSFHSVLSTQDPLQLIDKHPTEPLQVLSLDGATPDNCGLIEANIASMRDEPFDLATRPPLLWRLLRIDDTNHVLLIETSVLCHDRASLTNLVREISERYNGDDADVGDTVQYADFAEWQNGLLESEDADAGRAFWTRQHLSQTVDPQLTFERRLTGSRDFKPEIIEHNLEPERVARLQEISRTRGISLPSFLFAAWEVLLARLTSEREFVIANRFAGRGYPELERGLGLFAKYAPLKCVVEDTQTFSELAGHAEEALSKADGHQEYFDPRTFERGVHDDATLFPFCFAFFEQRQAFSAQGVRFTIESLCDHVEAFKLLLSCSFAGSTLHSELNYDSQLFVKADMERMVSQLDALLRNVEQNPDAAVDELEIIAPLEREQLLVHFNDTAESVSPELVPQMFERRAAENPNHIAAAFQNQTLTYAELDAHANQLAHRLVLLGVTCESRVALCLNRSLALPVALLGIMKAGGAYVPLDPTLPRERLRYMISETGAEIILTESALATQLPTSGVTVVCLDTERETIAAQSRAPLSRMIAPENLVYVIFTSGSTGHPKGVAIEHRQLAHYVYAILPRLKLPAQSTFATLSSASTDLGNTAIFPALCSGGALLIVPEEESMSAEKLAEYFGRHPVDCLKVVPTHLSALLSTSQPSQLLPRRCLVLGGEPCATALVEKIKSISDCAVFNHYGPTETTVGAITFEVTDDSIAESPSQLPLGKPLSNTQIYVLDKHMRPVPIGVAGELYIGGSGVGRGYINRPDFTGERFVPDPFGKTGERLYRTGDRAKVSTSGEFQFLGRLDHQVKLHGYRIELREIETVLVTHNSVAEAVVQVNDDGSGSQQLIAWVAPSADQIDPKALRAHLGQRLPDYMVPHHYVILNSLPLTASGKIDRNALPPFKLDQSNDRFVAPRDPVEEALVEIWRRVLNVPRVGILDNFFELGGDSIMSIQIIARANQSGLRLMPRQLFQHQTIAELAAVAKDGVRLEADQGIVTGEVPLTPVQARFFELNLPDPHHYNQARLLKLKPRIDWRNLKQAVELLLRQHDALRLRFFRFENTWRQIITEPESTVPFERIDIAEWKDIDVGDLLNAEATRLHKTLNLQAGPIMRVALFDGADKTSSYLLLVIHHLAIDAVSWSVLVEDLETAYFQLTAGEEVSLPAKTTSFKKWAEELAQFAGAATIKHEIDYWTSRVSQQRSIGLPQSLPVGQRGANRVASRRTVSVSLGAEETRSVLQDLPRTQRTQINEVLLTALTRTFTRWTGSSSFLIDLEGHGREQLIEGIDPARTVGWFTTIFPVLFEIGSASTPLEVLRAVKEQLRAIPNRGIGYGLVRYLSGQPEIIDQLSRSSQAEVRFNYLGQLDRTLSSSNMFSAAQYSVGEAQSPSGERGYLLNIICGVTNGELRFDWTYGENIHPRETIESLADTCLAELRALLTDTEIAGPAYAPADFPNAKLSQNDLNTILAKLRG